MKIKADYTNVPQWKETMVKSTLPKRIGVFGRVGSQYVVGMEL